MFEVGSKVFVFFNPKDMQHPEESPVVNAVVTGHRLTEEVTAKKRTQRLIYLVDVDEVWDAWVGACDVFAEEGEAKQHAYETMEKMISCLYERAGKYKDALAEMGMGDSDGM